MKTKWHRRRPPGYYQDYMILLTVLLALAVALAAGCLLSRRPENDEEATVILPSDHPAKPGDRVRIAAIAEDGERLESDFIVLRVDGVWARVRVVPGSGA